MIAADAEHASGRTRCLVGKSLRLLGDRGPTGWLAPQDVAGQVGLNYENFRKRFVQLRANLPAAIKSAAAARMGVRGDLPWRELARSRSPTRWASATCFISPRPSSRRSASRRRIIDAECAGTEEGGSALTLSAVRANAVRSRVHQRFAGGATHN